MLYCIPPLCRYYLRSIGVNPRKEPSDITAAFPELAADLRLPRLFPPDRLFSSVLRISSGMHINILLLACKCHQLVFHRDQHMFRLLFLRENGSCQAMRLMTGNGQSALCGRIWCLIMSNQYAVLLAATGLS